MLNANEYYGDLADQEENKNDDNDKLNKIEGFHTLRAKINAAHNKIPYKKEKLFIGDNETDFHIAIKDYNHWNDFFLPKILPNPSDWLAQYPEEKKGQTFNAWYRYIKKCHIYQTLKNPKLHNGCWEEL